MKTTYFNTVLAFCIVLILTGCQKELEVHKNPSQNTEIVEGSQKVNNTQLFYSRDVNNPKAFQMHVKSKNNGTVEIIRNEVGASHASEPHTVLTVPTPVGVYDNGFDIIVPDNKSYYIVPFDPDQDPILLAANNSFTFSCSCAEGNGTCRTEATGALGGGTFTVTCGPQGGCTNCTLTVRVSGAVRNFSGGSVVVEASNLLVKK